MTVAKSDYKVGRLIEKYALEDAEERLVEAWTRDDDNRASLRELADEFNRRVLRAVLVDAGMSIHDREIAETYRVLTADDVSSGVRLQSRRRLEQEGVDVDELESDFVSYQAIYNFLREYCEARYEPSSADDQVESDLNRINRLVARLRAVVEDDLERFDDTGRIDIGDHRVFVDVQVYCRECDSQVPLDDLLTDGGCDCAE